MKIRLGVVLFRAFHDAVKSVCKVGFVGDVEFYAARVGFVGDVRGQDLEHHGVPYLCSQGCSFVHGSRDLGGHNGEIAVDMAIWDIMGQHGFRALLQEAYFFGVDGIIAVCDLTRAESLEGLKDWLERTRETAGEVPVVNVGNKCDLEKERTISEEDLAKVAGQYNAEFAYTSAKTGENIEKLFVDLTREILRRIEERRYSENIEAPSESPAGQAS